MSGSEFVDRRARALASDPTLNVAVEASAGTGKTRVLVERYVRLVAEGAAPRHILAITFTRKAAGEMKSRIVEELRAREDLWKEVRARLFEIHITTIDAFCLGLLREFPLEAGLDPDVDLIDEVDADRLLEEAIDEVSAEARRGGVADYRFLTGRFGEGALRRGARDFLKSRLVKADLLERYVARAIPTGVEPEGGLRRFSESLHAALRGEDGLGRFVATGPETTGFRAAAFALGRAIDPKTIAAADVEEVAAYFLTRTGEPRRRVASAASRKAFSDRAAYERHRDRVVALAPFVARAYRQWLKEKNGFAVRELHRFYRAAAARFDGLKRARAALDFTDVLLAAVRLLERRGEFSQSRFRLESRYHHLLIDEFQDTNEVQWRLVKALVESWGEGAGLVQEAILSEQAQGRGRGRLREPTLFLVGDRKQSIYGFRDARVEVMERASRRLLRIRKGGGRRLTLRHSFRAGGDLLRFLNDVFAELPKVRSDLDWSFQYREEDHFPTGDPDTEARPVAVAAAPNLAQAASVVAGEIVRVLQEEGRRPRDVAVLFRSRTSYRAYEEALAARGVPTYVYRGLGFFDSPEVRDLEALVRFLAEPASELRASELARSRFVAVSDTGLARVALGKPDATGSPIASWLAGGDVRTSPPLSSADRARFERARRLVPGWTRLVDRRTPSELLERAIDESDYASWFRGDDQSWENLKKVLELVRRAENRGYLTMSRLSDYLASASTEDESPAILEAVDAVNLMTIHASKGLEFDTVCVVNLHQRTRQDTSLPRVRELPDGRVEVNALSAALPEEAAPEPNRVEEEEKRLLYVAFTRARRNLVLSTVVSEQTASEKERSFVRLLPESLQDVFRRAISSEDDELVWHGHGLRNLKPRRDRPGYSEDRPAPAHRLRLDPVPPDETRAGDTLARHPDDGASGERRAALFEAVSGRDELAALLSEGEIFEDVPVTLLDGGSIRRAILPILVVSHRGTTVVDLVDRLPREEDRRRLREAVDAAGRAFPDRPARGLLVSTEHAVFETIPTPASGDRDERTGGQIDLF